LYLNVSSDFLTSCLPAEESSMSVMQQITNSRRNCNDRCQCWRRSVCWGRSLLF